MGKTTLILAPIIVGGALLLLAFWGGRLFERVQRDVAAAHISPRVHDDLVGLVRRILAPTDDLDQVVVLPPSVRERAHEVLSRAEENERAIRAAARKRAGYR